MPISILLIPFAILLIIWIIFSVLMAWNLLSYIKDVPAAGLLVIVYAVGSAVIFIATWFFVNAIDWTTPLAF